MASEAKKNKPTVMYDQTERAKIQFLIGALKQKEKMQQETAKRNPAYARYLKSEAGKAEQNKMRALQDQYAKLDPNYAAYLRQQRSRQRG